MNRGRIGQGRLGQTIERCQVSELLNAPIVTRNRSRRNHRRDRGLHSTAKVLHYFRMRAVGNVRLSLISTVRSASAHENEGGTARRLDTNPLDTDPSRAPQARPGRRQHDQKSPALACIPTLARWCREVARFVHLNLFAGCRPLRVQRPVWTIDLGRRGKFVELESGRQFDAYRIPAQIGLKANRRDALLGREHVVAASGKLSGPHDENPILHMPAELIGGKVDAESQPIVARLEVRLELPDKKAVQSLGQPALEYFLHDVTTDARLPVVIPRFRARRRRVTPDSLVSDFGRSHASACGRRCQPLPLLPAAARPT